MKKNKKQFPLGLIVVALIAGLMLSFTTVQGARAALNEKSDDYDTTITMKKIDVEIVIEENDILANVPEDYIPGEEYETSVKVKNTGEIAEYVRVVVYRYWTDSNGNKDTSLDPEMIVLDLGGDGWVLDEDAHTAERDILYYSKPLESGEEKSETSSVISSVKVDTEVMNKVTITEKDGVITKTYAYNDKNFVIEIEVDSIQEHNYVDAAKSAWGVDINSKIGG